MKKLILLILLLASFSAHAQLTCVDLFNENTYAINESDLGIPKSLSGKLRAVKIMAFPKLGLPSYRGTKYDISLVGNPKKVTYDPNLVLAKAREIIESFLTILETQGLKSKHRSHFVIEISPGGLGNKEGKIGFLNSEIGGPFTANEGIGVMVEGFAGSRRRLTSKDYSQVVIIPMDDFGGPRLARFVIAHEVGHDVVRSNNYSLNEAMADYIGWLLTGKTGFSSTKPVESEVMDADGNIKTVMITKFRDIAIPEVSKLSQVKPSVERFHANSTVFSHIFLKIDEKFGHGKSISLIKFLEEQVERTPVINDMTKLEDNMSSLSDFISRSFETPKGIMANLKMIFFGGGNLRGGLNILTDALAGSSRKPYYITLWKKTLDTERSAIKESFLIIGTLIREWASDPKNRVSAEEVNQILKDAEI